MVFHKLLLAYYFILARALFPHLDVFFEFHWHYFAKLEGSCGRHYGAVRVTEPPSPIPAERTGADPWC